MNFCRFYNNTMDKLKRIFETRIEGNSYYRYDEVEEINIFKGLAEIIWWSWWIIVLGLLKYIIYVPINWTYHKLYDLTTSKKEKKMEDEKL